MHRNRHRPQDSRASARSRHAPSPPPDFLKNFRMSCNRHRPHSNRHARPANQNSAAVPWAVVWAFGGRTMAADSVSRPSHRNCVSSHRHACDTSLKRRVFRFGHNADFKSNRPLAACSACVACGSLFARQAIHGASQAMLQRSSLGVKCMLQGFGAGVHVTCAATSCA